MKKIIIILAIFTFDRITKIYFINLQEVGNDVDIYIFPFLDFIFRYNIGTAFSLFQLEPNSLPYHILTTFIAIINFIVFLVVFSKINNSSVPKRILNFLRIPKSWRKDLHSYIFALILGGGSGNLYDRIVNHAVVDFIDFHIADFHWPTFNIADSFITLGIIGLVFVELMKKEIIEDNAAIFSALPFFLGSKTANSYLPVEIDPKMVDTAKNNP